MDHLERHRPSEDAIRRAGAAGIDLETARREDPQTYMMVCSQPVLRVAAELREVAEAPLRTALVDQQLFEARDSEAALMLAFPGPDREQLERLDELLAVAVEREARDRYAFYRLVSDRAGSRRELALPTSPDRWAGAETMVGPFGDEEQANEWARARLDPRSGTTFDVLAYAGAWFCDLFRVADT